MKDHNGFYYFIVPIVAVAFLWALATTPYPGVMIGKVIVFAVIGGVLAFIGTRMKSRPPKEEPREKTEEELERDLYGR